MSEEQTDVAEIEGVELTDENLLMLEKMFGSPEYALLKVIIAKMRSDNFEGTIGNMKLSEAHEFYRSQGIEFAYGRLDDIRGAVSDILRQRAQKR